jgi:hypothetical protein
VINVHLIKEQRIGHQTSLRELHKKNELLAAALVPSGTLSRSLSNGILTVLVLLAGKMPALQEILGLCLSAFICVHLRSIILNIPSKE